MVDNTISPYILVIVLAWFIAQLIKFVINISNDKKYRLRSHIVMSGGMPSGHSASVCALATIVGLREGAESAIFGLTVLVAFLFMYDAIKVRRASGEQGIALVNMIKEQKSKIRYPRVAKGHSPTEVIFGALLGIAVGIVVYLYTI